MVRLETGIGTLIERAASLVQEFWPRQEIFDHARDKIIIYCGSRDEVYELATMLKCPSYTFESGSEEERAVIISQWIGNSGQPAIVATSALGIGFDYAHVRWVIHIDAPGEASSFSQESGRAGRDGKQASSIVLLWSRWKPDLEGRLSPDQEAMQLFLSQHHCSRGVLSQFFDAPSDWRWCMSNDTPCQVCKISRTTARPSSIVYTLPRKEMMEFTGPAEILR